LHETTKRKRYERKEIKVGTTVLVLGNSGTGKSASMRNLDPNKYGLVNPAKKPLPFKSDKKALNSDDYKRITETLARATSNIIVIDDAQYLMANAWMRRAQEKGYDKYTEIGLDFFNLIEFVIEKMPSEKIVYFMGHTEIDNNGNTKFKTIGKMLDEKITIEGLFTIVLRTYVQRDPRQFFFTTQNDGTDTVKTPIGMFTESLIDNDLVIVDKAIRDYYGLVA
jgi:hypothetical protein